MHPTHWDASAQRPCGALGTLRVRLGSGPIRGIPGVPGTHHGSGLIQRKAKVDDLLAFVHQRLPEEVEAASESLAKEVTGQFPPTGRFDQFKRTATATPVRGSRWRSWERGGNGRSIRQRRVPGDFQTRSGITPNAMSLSSEPMPRPELVGGQTLSCGSLTEAAIPNGVPESSARGTS